MQITSILVGLQSRQFSFEILEYGVLHKHGGGYAPGANIHPGLAPKVAVVGFEFLEHGALF